MKQTKMRSAPTRKQRFALALELKPPGFARRYEINKEVGSMPETKVDLASLFNEGPRALTRKKPP